VRATCSLLVALSACGRVGFGARPLVADGGAADARPVDAGFPPGLVAWYRLDETIGDTYADAIGGVTAVCASFGTCPAPTAGRASGAQLFDGDTTCIQVPDMGQLDLSAFTVAVWARQDAHASAIGTTSVAKRVDVGSDVLDSWQMEDYVTGSPNDQLVFTSNLDTPTNAQFASSTDDIVIGAWQHLAITWDSASETETLYVAGAFEGSHQETGNIQYDSHAATIGCDDNAGASEVFVGALQGMQVYNRALTAAEIAMLAQL
jgi:concanavalin A-like lectin/glucanase superfamily protein